MTDDDLRSKRQRREPAMTFPYTLDPFQQRSIDHLEDGDSVLVSAHTSAGKTTVAQYAIAKALNEKKRVIYTSPIKALSNQKYKEFSERYGSVGLMTGDTTIKADSDCLVMTTEILRSMLYRGTEMLREVGCVIFDEVHYMRDKARGVVWEETIIMLPEGCQYVFLSATIPNAAEFAGWVEHVHPNTKCHVVYTNMRPVPLQHYFYPEGADGIFLIVDDQSKFRDENFRKAMMALGADQREAGAIAAAGGGAADQAKQQQRRKPGNKKAILDIIQLVMEKQMAPVIVFAFSKKQCELNALSLAKLNFNNDEEDALVQEVFNNAIESLAEDDRQLPAVEHLIPLLRRGIGIHHSGLLPVLKEVVELLFQAGLVKVLFSTETFSMGLNMPARTVVFTSLQKFDGDKERYLTGGEYIQMSGRAGRRGLDRVGVVIAMIDEQVNPDAVKELVGGGADVLNSSFHLTYNMVLNLLRVEGVDPEFMMTRSFYQFQRARERPVLEAKIAELTAKRDAIVIENEEVCREYVSCAEQIKRLEEQNAKELLTPRYLKPFLQVGRIVLVQTAAGKSHGWGVVRGFEKTATDETLASSYRVDVYVLCHKIEPGAPRVYEPIALADFTTEVGDLYSVSFSMEDVRKVSRFRCGVAEDEAARMAMIKTLAKLDKQFGSDVPLLSAEEMGVESATYTKNARRIEAMRKQMAANPLSSAPSEALAADFAKFREKAAIEVEVERLSNDLTAISATVLQDELKQIMRVLRRLDYIDKDNLILRKGRVACEITTTDENEILLTELLFKGLLNDMETEMIVALLSTLVNQHSADEKDLNLPEMFRGPLKELQEVVERINQVCVESGLMKEGAVTEKVMPSLMEVTYKWTKGAKFIDIVGLTSAYEGDIVRMMRRLEELLRQLAGAAMSPAIGSVDLHDKFMRGIELIKRDIIFAPSLYL